MNRTRLDPYRAGISALHQLDVRARLVLSLAFILTTALLPAGAWGAYLLLLSFILSAAVIAGLGTGFVLKRSLLALPIVLVAVPVMFTLAGEPLAQIDLNFFVLILTRSGLERFLSVALKTWISFQAAVLLAAVTPFPDLLLALRALRVPRLLVAIIGLMWRYLFVLMETANHLMQARTARSGHSRRVSQRSGGSLVWRARVTGGMVGTLFLRSMERADRIYAAMLARGYDGEVRSLPLPPIPMRARIIVLAGLFIFATTLLFGFLITP